MIILICGAEGSGKTTLAKPFADLLGAQYVNKDTYSSELKGYIDGIVSTGKTVVVDKRCKSNEAIEYLKPDYIVWMDTVTDKTEKPLKVDYHVSKWFNNTHEQLVKVVKNFILKREGKPTQVITLDGKK